MITTVLSVGTMVGIDVDTYLAAAAGAGFDGVSLRPAGIEAWRATGRTLRDLRARIDDRGLLLAEVDPVTGWAGGEVPDAALHTLDVAAVLGAHAVSALVLPGEPDAEARLSAGFAAICAEAAERGLRVQLEGFAWSPVRTLELAGRVAGGPANGGVLVDTWHVARAGEGVADVMALGVDQVLALQVADGPATPVLADVAAECRDHRRWPGEGELGPGGVVRTLIAHGWSGPVGVEVFGTATDDPDARARQAHRALTTLLPEPFDQRAEVSRRGGHR